MVIYNKLVRDKIPQIIENDRRTCDIRVLDDTEMIETLVNKLKEEVTEFEADNNLEELADILEVVYELAKRLGFNKSNLEDERLVKRRERGGFENNMFLKSVEY